MSEFKISAGDSDSYFYIETTTGDVALKHQGVDVQKWPASEAAASGAGGPYNVKVPITSAEILALAAAPKELIAAPGPNKVIQVLGCLLQLLDDGTPTDYDDAAADGDLQLRYVDGSGVAVGAAVDADAFIDATAEAFQIHVPAATITATVAQLENTAIVLDNDGAEFTTGDRSMVAHLTYRVIDVS